MVEKKINFHQLFLILIKLITTLKEKDISIPPYKKEFKIKSPNFLFGEKIPKKYTPYGEDIHPSFYWYNFPKKQKVLLSFVKIQIHQVEKYLIIG